MALMTGALTDPPDRMRDNKKSCVKRWPWSKYPPSQDTGGWWPGWEWWWRCLTRQKRGGVGVPPCPCQLNRQLGTRSVFSLQRHWSPASQTWFQTRAGKMMDPGQEQDSEQLSSLEDRPHGHMCTEKVAHILCDRVPLSCVAQKASVFLVPAQNNSPLSPSNWSSFIRSSTGRPLFLHAASKDLPFDTPFPNKWQQHSLLGCHFSTCAFLLRKKREKPRQTDSSKNTGW